MPSLFVSITISSYLKFLVHFEISSRFLCLLPYPCNGKFAIGLGSKELKDVECNHLLSFYPWIVASIGLVSSYAVHGSSCWHSLFKEHHAGPVG